jgi:FLVCR family MFS transporter 7
MAASSKSELGLSFRQSLLNLATNWNFLIVFVAFSIIAGLASGLTSLIPQIVAPYGIGNAHAGLVSAAFIVAGLVGSIITGVFLDKVGHGIRIVKIYIPTVGAAYLAFYFVGNSHIFLIIRLKKCMINN